MEKDEIVSIKIGTLEDMEEIIHNKVTPAIQAIFDEYGIDYTVGRSCFGCINFRHCDHVRHLSMVALEMPIELFVDWARSEAGKRSNTTHLLEKANFVEAFETILHFCSNSGDPGNLFNEITDRVLDCVPIVSDTIEPVDAEEVINYLRNSGLEFGNVIMGPPPDILQ